MNIKCQLYINGIKYHGQLAPVNGGLKYTGNDLPKLDDALVEIYDGNTLYEFQAIVNVDGLIPTSRIGILTKNSEGRWRTARYFLEGGI